MARRRAWADFIVNLALVTDVPQSVDLLTQAPDLDTLTVARLIGKLTVWPASMTTQVDSHMIVDIGVGVASVEAFGVAASAGLPIVIAVASAPPRGWLYRSQIDVMKVHSTGTTFEIAHAGEDKFDIGAMRKVDKGVLYLVAQSTLIDGTAMTVDLTGLVRSMCLT